jgi:hypothetical protein
MNPDVTNEDPEYWDEVLRSHDLAEEKGRPPQVWVDRGEDTEYRYRVVNFVGTTDNLTGVQEQEFRKKSGKDSPSGHGPE